MSMVHRLLLGCENYNVIPTIAALQLQDYLLLLVPEQYVASEQ